MNCGTSSDSGFSEGVHPVNLYAPEFTLNPKKVKTAYNSLNNVGNLTLLKLLFHFLLHKRSMRHHPPTPAIGKMAAHQKAKDKKHLQQEISEALEIKTLLFYSHNLLPALVLYTLGVLATFFL